MEHDEYSFPETLNEQTRIIGLPIDELLIVAPLVVGGVMAGRSGTCCITAAILWITIRHFKKGQGSTWLLNLAYWFLPTEIFKSFGVFRVIPDSSKRHWLW